MRLLATAIAAAALAACTGKSPAPEVHDSDMGKFGACASCHMPDYDQVRRPLHVGVKPVSCGICHTQDSWRPSRLDHPWPLSGAHLMGTCFYCHKGDPPQFKGTPKECVGCHREDYESAPDHVELSFPTTCEQCHSTTAWKPRLADAPAAPTRPPPPPEPVPSAAPSATATVPKPHPTWVPPPHPTPTPTTTDTISGASGRLPPRPPPKPAPSK